MNDILKKNSQYQWGLYLLQFEALCHFNLIKYLVEIFKMDTLQPEYGCKTGLNTFVIMGYQLDASVFL